MQFSLELFSQKAVGVENFNFSMKNKVLGGRGSIGWGVGTGICWWKSGSWTESKELTLSYG